MKRTYLTLIVIFFLISGLLRAQVNYTAAEFGVAGDSMLYSVLTPGGGGVNYTQAGANVNWNFATLTPTSQYTLYFLNPDNAGYLNTYVNACVSAGGTTGGCTSSFNTLTNVAFLSPDSVRAGLTSFDNIVAHDLNSNNQLTDNIIGVTAHINGAPVQVGSPLSPPDVVRVFPLSYGNTDSSVSNYTIDLTPYGMNFIYYAHTKRVNVVDAWGSLTTPYTTYASVVREYTTVTHTDTVVINGTTRGLRPNTTVEYSWFDPASIAPVMTVLGNLGFGTTPNLTRVLYHDRALCFPPTVRVRFTPRNPSINPSVGNVTVTFTNRTTNANTYSWNFGNPSSRTQDTSSLTNPTHSYDSAGTYIVELIACNTNCIPEVCDTVYYPITVTDSGAPVAAFRGRPATICENDSVVFTNNSRGATGYYWEFGDGDTSTAQSPTHFYTTVGTYTVVLIAYNTIGSDTARHTINVQAPPTANVQIIGDTSFCNGDSVILNASGGARYRWSNGRGRPTIVVKTSGIYTVTVSNSCGSVVSSPVTVTVNTPVDTIVATGDTAICQGDSVMLQANIVTGGIYSWKRNNQIIAGATQSYYYVKTGGRYVVNIYSDSCVGVSNIIRVTVSATPNAHITAQGSTINCSGDSVRLIANIGFNLSWQWQVNNQNIAGATDSVYEALTSGTYDVVTTRGGCSRTSNTIIVSNNSTPSPVINYTGNPSFCAGDRFMLTTPPGNGYTYQWQLNGFNIPGAINEYYNVTATGSYTVMAISGPCAGTSSAVTVTQHAVPAANAGTTQTLVACSNLATDTLGGNPAATGGLAPYTYLWSPPAGLNATNISNPTVNNLGANTEFYLLVTDSNGCSSTDSVQVNVTGGSGISVTIPAGIRVSAACFGSPDSLLLSAQVTGGTPPYTYSWTPGNVLSNTDSSSTIATPVAVGTYNFTVVVVDNFGCTGSAARQFSVYALPDDTITILGSNTFCSGDSVTLSAAPGSGYNYQWMNNGVVLNGANNVNFTTTVSGNYSVEIQGNGCTDTSAATTVTVVSAPAAIITGGDTGICTGASALLSMSTGTGYSYQWYEGGFGIGGANNSTYSAIDSASYYVVVTAGGCSAQSDSVFVSVYPYPSDSVAVNGPTTFCAGATVGLSTQTVNGYTYQWLNNGASLAGDVTSGLTVDSSGLYAVAVTANGCTSTSTEVQVVVTPYPNNTISAIGNTSFCQGDSVTLSVPQNAGYSYQWLMNGDSLISGAANNTLTVSDSAGYSVIVALGGCVDTSQSITTNVLPLPSASIVQSGNTMYASAGGTSYQWYTGSTAITGATSQIYSPGQNGTYSVVVTDSLGCNSTSAPFTFVYTGIQGLTSQNASVTLYPNPAHDAVTILLNTENETDATVKLYDLVGKQLLLVFEGHISAGSNRFSLNLTNLPQGIYVLRSDFGSSAITSKIVKQ